MTILTLIIYLIIIGVLLWLINYIPMARPIKAIINIIVVIAVIIWLLNIFGLMDEVKQAVNIPVTTPHLTTTPHQTTPANKQY